MDDRITSQRTNIINVKLKLGKGEAGMSHAKEESVLKLKEVELTTRISEGAEVQLWDVVMEKEESYARIDKRRSDEVFERNQVESEFLNCLLEASEYDVFIKDIEQRLFGDEIKV